jgi:hypothetical protein
MWQRIFFLHSKIWGRIGELNKGWGSQRTQASQRQQPATPGRFPYPSWTRVQWIWGPRRRTARAVPSMVTQCTKPDTRTPNLKYPDPDPKYLNPHYPISNSDSESYYPNLYWVIRVSTPGTRTTRNRNTSQRSAKSRSEASPISRGPSPTMVGCLLGFGASLTHVLTCRLLDSPRQALMWWQPTGLMLELFNLLLYLVGTK